METTATAQRHEEDVEAESSTRIASLKGTVLAGANGSEGRAAADKLAVALKDLAVRSPTPATRDLLQGILDRKELDGFADSAGVSCRAAVINAQVALGFPYALEVSPEDLVKLREVTQGLRRPGHDPLAAATVSLVWNGSLALLSLLSTIDGIPKNDVLLAGAAFGVGTLHAMAALVVRSKPRRRVAFQMLAMLGLLGPLFSVVLPAVFMPNPAVALLFVFGLIAAAPAMYTAIKCGLASRSLPPDED